MPCSKSDSIPAGKPYVSAYGLVPGMAVLLGIDKFMSECRALTNIIGNGVATIVVSRWENELDRDMLKVRLGQSIDPTDISTAITTG